MNCYNHGERAAVATCTACGMNYCKACIDRTGSKEPLCPKCCIDGMRAEFVNAKQNLETAKAIAGKNETSLIVFPILYVIGLVIMLSARQFPNNEIANLLGFVIMGIPAISAALTFGRDTAKYTEGGFLLKVVAFLFGMAVVILLGFAITPLVIITRLFKISSYKKAIEEAEALCEKINKAICSDQDLQELIAGR